MLRPAHGMPLRACVLAFLTCLGAFAPAGAARAQDDFDAPPPEAMWEHVTVYRDDWGAPHVLADSVRAMAFGLGYAQAEDHIEPMLLAYRVAMGRASEILGPEHAASDAFSLRMGHGEMAEAAFRHADPITRDLCEGFALGVNMWLSDAGPAAPPWAEGVRPHEILALLHCYLMSHAPFDLPDFYHRAAPAVSGNAWALSAGRTTGGAPILAINPHTDWTGPFQWYEAHLIAPGLNVAGATLFGLPVILQGHNGMLGWGLSPNEADIADVFLASEPQWDGDLGSVMSPESLAYAGDYLSEGPRLHEYLVYGDAGFERRNVEVMITGRGPVLGRVDDQFVIWRIGGYHDFGALLQIFRMGAAQRLEDFQAALAMHQLPCFHVVYADRAGNLLYLYNARSGRRYQPEKRDLRLLAHLIPEEPPVDYRAPISGDDPRYDWGGDVEIAALPGVVNPPSGYLAASGNPPWTATGGPDFDPEAWPEWFVADQDSYRARRVRSLIEAAPRSFDDVQAMLYDVYVPFGSVVGPRLKTMLEQNPALLEEADADTRTGIELLLNWTQVAEPSSEGMTFFHVWLASYRGLAPRYPDETLLFDAFANGEHDPRITFEAIGQAARLLRNEYGAMSVPWGEVHVVRRGDREEPMPGAASGQPVFVAGDHRFRDGKWQASYGYGYARVVEFGDRVRSVSMVPFGTSQRRGSAHYNDQMDLLVQRRFKVVRFDLEEVQTFAEEARGRFVELRAPGLDGVVRVHAQAPVRVTLESSVEPPIPLPEDKSAYSVFLRPIHAPAQVGAMVAFEAYIPPEICPDAQFGELAVYTYQHAEGWRPVALQQADPQARVLMAQVEGLQRLVVLGPRVEGAPVQDAAEAVAREAVQAATERTSVDLDAGTVELPPVAPLPNPETDEAAPTPEEAPSDAEDTAAEPSIEAPPGDTAIAWGRSIALTPPGAPGAVYITADRVIGAKLLVSEEPPAPLPDGRQAFTRYVTVESSSPEAPMQVSVELVVPEGRCSAEQLTRLELYGWRSDAGWAPLDDTRVGSDRTLSGVDDAPGVYVALGPPATP